MAYLSSNSLTSFAKDKCVFCDNVNSISNPNERLSTITEGLKAIKAVCVTKQEHHLHSLALSKFTGLHDNVSDHAENGSSRKKRDWCDLQKLLKFFRFNSPLRFSDRDRLVSLSSGVVAVSGDCVTSDCAEEIGSAIQESWNGKRFTEITYHRSKKVKTLADLSNTCKISGEQVVIDVNSLFHRLVVLAERSTDLKTYFAFELTQYPTSLFKDGFMRKPVKPDLYKGFTKGLTADTLPTSIQFVVDGGYLLHKVRWAKGLSISQILQMYSVHVRSNYGSNAVLVFDGYTNDPSTKDHEHRRRTMKASKKLPRWL